VTIPDGAARQRTSCRTALAIALASSLFSASPARALIQAATCVASQPEVKAVTFHGNASIPSQTLEATIETAPSSTVRRLLRVFGTRRCLAEGALPRDAARLMLFYRRKGYPRVAVDTAVERAGTGGVRVRFSIRENAPTVVDSVEIRGVSDEMRSRLRRGVQLRPGDPLDRFSLEASSTAMVAGLRRAGYLAATARSGTRVDSSATHGVGWIEVTPGARVRLGDVRVDARGVDSARPQIPASRVAGLTRLRPGAVLGSHELTDARRSLEAIGLYDEIRISVDSSRPTPAADGAADGVGGGTGDGVADVTVGVVEGSANEVRLRAGYGTLDCIRVQLQGHRLGVARRPGRFEITTRLSKVAVGKPLDFAPGLCSSEVQADPYSSRLNYYVGGTYAMNSLGPHGWSRQISVYTERRSEYLAYLKTTNIGGSASLTHGFGRNWSGTAAYDLSYGRTEAEPAVLCATFSACLAADREQFSETLPFGLLSVAATFDNTDMPLDPTRGVSVRAEGRIAPQWLGTAVRQQIGGARLNVAGYVSLAKRVVLAGRAQGAVVATLPGAEFIPQGERLFAGGASTVRGFQQNEVGPRVYLADSVTLREMDGDTLVWALPPDSTHWRAVPTGGTASAVANIELRVRPPVLTSLIQFVAFVDGGKVWTSDETQDFDTPFYVTPGIGVRASTPIGPIRLDIASNAYDPPGGPAYRDAPLGYETAPLYCVSPGNRLRVTGFGQTDAQGRPIPPVQEEGPCPATFRPSRASGFFNRLTITFSIGQAF
jgi:outer membrane protein insertion porin family/translocation and assembly module TamA